MLKRLGNNEISFEVPIRRSLYSETGKYSSAALDCTVCTKIVGDIIYVIDDGIDIIYGTQI